MCQAASFCQRIHLLILNKISELVSRGIDETKAAQRALHHYVKHTLPIEYINITPSPTDRAFCSLLNDKNHVLVPLKFTQSSSLPVAPKNIPGVCFEVSVDVCESGSDCTWDL